MPSSAKPLAGRPLSQVEFAFVDTETTGLSHRYGGRICEIGIVTVRAGRELGRFQSLVNPDCPISYGAMMVHGITDEMVAQEPTFAELADEVAEHLAGRVLVAHNAPFDVGFLTAEFARLGRPMPDVPVLCTLKLARRHFKFPSNRLGAIAESLGVGTGHAHRASADAVMLKDIFARFTSEFEKKGLCTLESLESAKVPGKGS